MLDHATSVFVSDRNLHHQRFESGQCLYLPGIGRLFVYGGGRAETEGRAAGAPRWLDATPKGPEPLEPERERGERNNLLDGQVGDRVNGRANKIRPAPLGNQTVGERARRRKDNLRKERPTSNNQVRK